MVSIGGLLVTGSFIENRVRIFIKYKITSENNKEIVGENELIIESKKKNAFD